MAISKLRPLIFAHRGGTNWAPENTLCAFSQCLTEGIDAVELDVYKCASNQWVVIHDEEVSRTTGHQGYVWELTINELNKLSAGANFNGHFANERIPLLNDVLSLLNEKIIVNIEMKAVDSLSNEDYGQALYNSIYSKFDLDKIIFSSFDYALLRQLRKCSSFVKLALLTKSTPTNIWKLIESLQINFWHPCFGAFSEADVLEAHRLGLKVNTWTVNKPPDWDRATYLSVDGIITDDPLALKLYLKA